MDPNNLKRSVLKAQSALFDPDLPTAGDVMVAICCVTTRYALNPSLDLAKLALRLAGNLNAPEVVKSEYLEEVAKKVGNTVG